MRHRSLIAAFTALCVIGVTISCSNDSPTSPSSEAAREPASRSLLGNPVTVVPLQRTSPLNANVQTSATIGILGGTLSIPQAGFQLVIPPLALTSPVTITATALAGSAVAYELAPHGLTFIVPALATQNLGGTQARLGGPVSSLSLFVGYFPNSLQLTSVTELLSLQLNLLSQTSTATITHFSGYVWSSGRSEEGSEGGAQ